jgi:hypothetical protein
VNVVFLPVLKGKAMRLVEDVSIGVEQHWKQFPAGGEGKCWWGITADTVQ